MKARENARLLVHVREPALVNNLPVSLHHGAQHMANRPIQAKLSVGTAVLMIIVLGMMWIQHTKQRGAGQATPSPATPSSISPSKVEPLQRPSTNSASPTPGGSDDPAAKNSTGPAPASEGAARVTPRDVRIGAWNIEWLGKPDERSGPARGVAQSPADIADYILFADVSILGLCEIVPEREGTRFRNRVLEEALALVEKKSGERWEYALFPGHPQSEQLIGAAWSTADVAAMDADGNVWDQRDDRAWKIPLGPAERGPTGSPLWARTPHAMRFVLGDGATDIVLVTVHMKADYNGDFAAHRAREAAVLARAWPDIASEFAGSISPERDIVIIGDTNCVQKNEPAFEEFAKAGLIDLATKGNAAPPPTHWRDGAMDRVLVPGDQPEFAASTFEVISGRYLRERDMDNRDFKRRLSDHFMVVTTLKSQRDDD